MNSEMLRTALAVIASPEFIADFQAKLIEKQAKRDAFLASATFRMMRDTILAQPGPADFDTEEAKYFVDKIKARFGWPDVTEAEIQLFVDLVADSRADTVAAGSTTEDEDCPFDNVSYQNHGLTVFVMQGQGSFIRISNGRVAPTPVPAPGEPQGVWG